jgi:short-subunit dehydrogenase
MSQQQTMDNSALGGRELAVITGASSGIGAALARRLAGRGYRTVLIARRIELLRTLQRELAAAAPSDVIATDLADPAAVDATIERIITDHGVPRVLINCAGYGVFRTFLDHAEVDFTGLMQVNYFAPARFIHRLLPGMLEAGRGHVINVTSISAKFGPWGHSGYAAAKAALTSLTQSLACEYGQRGVHFSYVKPGIVDTEYFQTHETQGLWSLVKRRAIKADVVAAAVMRLMDRPRIELCVPGHYRFLDLIRAISPSLALKMVGDGSRPPAEAMRPMTEVATKPKQGAATDH